MEKTDPSAISGATATGQNMVGEPYGTDSTLYNDTSRSGDGA